MHPTQTPDLVVILGCAPAVATEATSQLRRLGSVWTWISYPSRDRALVHGGVFCSTQAASVVAALRSDGWSADVRPAGGGHLAAWLRHTAPVEIDERLTVGFPWSAGRVTVSIDPMGAFGSGGHPSTRLLLSVLAARLRPGQTVLDVGCGSGVLAISAAVLGGVATGIDISPSALVATAANAARNGVSVAFSAAGAYDVALANISASVLVSLAGSLVGWTGGWLGISGISPAQVSVVTAALRPLVIDSVLADDEWAAVVLRGLTP